MKDLPNISGAKAKGGKSFITVEWKPLSAKEHKKRKIKKVQIRIKYKKNGKICIKTYQYPQKIKKGKKASVKVNKLPQKGTYQVQIRCLGAGNKNSQHVSKKWSKWMKATVK